MFQTNYNAINASIAFVLNVFKNLSNAHSDALIIILQHFYALKYDIILKHKAEDCKINDVKKKNEFKKRYELEKKNYVKKRLYYSKF